MIHVVILVGAKAPDEGNLIKLVRLGGVLLIERLGILGRDGVIRFFADLEVIREFFNDRGAVDLLPRNVLGFNAAGVRDGLRGIIHLNTGLVSEARRWSGGAARR